MNRSHSTRAIVLKNSRIGEIHKGVVMLTEDGGLSVPSPTARILRRESFAARPTSSAAARSTSTPIRSAIR